MKTTALLARRMLLRSKTGAVFSVLIAALSVASTVAVFCICARGFSAFLAQVGQWGVSPLSAAYNGLRTLIYVSVQLGLSVFVEDFETSPVEDLFSEKAIVETQPALLLLIALCVLIVSFFSLKIMFAVHKKVRRHFYSTLLSAGASPSFARECAREEARFLCVRGIPAGLTLGYIAAVIFGAAEAALLRNGSLPSAGLDFVGIGLFLLAGAAAALFGYLFVTVCAGDAVRELTVKNTAAETRERQGVNIGVSVFTPEEYNRRLFGFSNHVALRNMENHIEKYAAVFFANAVYMSVCGISILVFFIAAKYNGLQPGAADAASRSLLAATVRYVSAAAAMQLLSVLGTFFAMLSNFESNTGGYVLMRALGASERLIRSMVRREGVLCVLFAGACSSACTVFLSCLLYNIYGRAAGLTLQALLSALTGIGVMMAVFAVGVAAAVRVACRRIAGLDLIRELKEFSYS